MSVVTSNDLYVKKNRSEEGKEELLADTIILHLSNQLITPNINKICAIHILSRMVWFLQLLVVLMNLIIFFCSIMDAVVEGGDLAVFSKTQIQLTCSFH